MKAARSLSHRFRAAVVVAVAAVGLAVLAFSGLEDSLVYYRTPTEVQQTPPDVDKRIRLGGLVVPASVTRDSESSVRMVLTDGVHEVEVWHTGALPEIFEDGQGAVVEGSFDGAGRFHSDLLMVRHSNEYRPPEESAAQPGPAG